MKTNTDQQAIKEVLGRGVATIVPGKKFLAEALAAGRRLKLYCGFDPSASSLHIGNAILLNKLRQFQALGHEVVFLVGDFTGMIGDPTDKTSVRRQLTREQVLANAKHYQRQAGVYLNFGGKNPARLLYNSQWQDKLTFRDLIGLSSHFTVQQMIQRDMFQERLQVERPIYLHEFLYPLAQAYDSVVLDVDMEIGGNDQMFNMLCGRDLMRALGKKDKSVLMMKLLTDAGGAKMGKTAGNAVFLDTPANDMYGLIMSWSDEVMIPAFELVTTMPWPEVIGLAKKLSKGGLNPRDLKMRLAREITGLAHGQTAAQAAEEHFARTVQRKEAPAKLRLVKLKDGETLLAALVNYFGSTKSKSALRRLIEQGAVTIDDVKANNFNVKLKAGSIIKAGKRDWFKVG